MVQLINKILFAIIVISINNNAFAFQQKDLSFADTVEKLSPSVVNISTAQILPEQLLQDLLEQIPKESPFYKVFQDLLAKQDKKKKTQNNTLGSGFIISEDGYIVTNNHVIGEAKSIEVTFSDGKSEEARIIGRDKKTDLALIKVDIDQKLQPVKFADSDKARPGDWVIAIGNPFGLGGSVTAGIISARGREISTSGIVEYIQTDTAINRGNSGGPMFNQKGRVIGINTAIFSTDGANIGIGFAIPSNLAQSVIKQLKETGSVTRGWLGVHVQDISDEMAKALDLKNTDGAYVIKIVPNSPAEKSGLKIDDIIIKFDNKNIKKTSQLPRIVSNTSIDKNVSLQILRKIDNKLQQKDLDVLIIEHQTQNNSDSKPTIDKTNTIFGMQLIELAKIRDYFDYPSDTNGLIILDIDRNEQNSAFEVGDLITKINQNNIENIDNLKQIITDSENDNKDYLLFSAKRKNENFITTINISEALDLKN
jgi:serine protease Do